MRVLAIAAVLLTSSIAAAQAPGQTVPHAANPYLTAPPPEVAPATIRVSYTSDILVADGLSLALMTLGPAAEADLAGVGVAGYFLAAPIVHLAHGRGAAAAKSLGLRVGMPLVLGLAGYKLGPHDTVCDEAVDIDGQYHSGHCNTGSIGGLLVGGLGGMIAAVVIDAKYLAKYDRPALPTWSANVQRTREGFAVGLSRSF